MFRNQAFVQQDYYEVVRLIYTDPVSGTGHADVNGTGSSARVCEESLNALCRRKMDIYSQSIHVSILDI